MTVTGPDVPPAEPPNVVGGTAARCYRHPNREANVRCTRCERPICTDCMRDAPVGFHCPDDVTMARRTVRTQRTVVGAQLRNSPPYVTATIIALNVVIYAITARQSVGGFRQAGDGSSKLFTQWQLTPFTVHHNGEYYRLLTATFLHVNFLHIFSNMLALVIIGPGLERILGRWRFTAVYLLGGLMGSAFVYAWSQIYTAEVGASGAIFGLFAAALVLVRKLGLDPQWLIGVIVLNFVFTFSIHNISKLGHIGGFVGGGIAAIAIAGLPQVRQRVSLQTQVLGLGGVAAVIVAIVAIRSTTF